MFCQVPPPLPTTLFMTFMIGNNNGYHYWVKFFTNITY